MWDEAPELVLGSASATQVAGALRGLLMSAERPHLAWSRIPDLEPLGRSDLLTSGIRRDLVRLRDRAVRDRAIAEDGSLTER